MNKLLAAILITMLGVATVVPAEAKYQHHKTVEVQLANGKTVRFKLMMMHGQMMAVIPASEFRDAMGHTIPFQH